MNKMSDRSSFRRFIVDFPVLGSLVTRLVREMRNSLVAVAPRRLKLAWRYLGQNNRLALSWVFEKTEEDNFLYALDSMNLEDLKASLAAVLKQNLKEVEVVFEEVLQDGELARHLSAGLELGSKGRQASDIIGRRVVWYAAVRLLKPALVVETGVHRGVGACVISSGLLRNRAEGFPGTYLGTEINPEFGDLYTEPYSEMGQIVYGDSIDTLNASGEAIDLFVNDSDHSSDYELREYQAIASRLSSNGVILGDNSHSSPSLREWSKQTNRPFVFLREKPEKHWYPGAGVGISLPPRG